MIEFNEPDLDLPEALPEEKGGKEKPVNLEELRRDVRKLMAWSQIIHQQNRAIKRRLTWMTIGSYLRLLLLLAPLILLAIYVPRWVEEFKETAASVRSGEFMTSSTLWQGAGVTAEQAQKLIRERFNN